MDKKGYSFLNRRLKGSYRYIFIAVIFIMISSYFSFLGPKLIGVAVDSVIGTLPFDLPPFVLSLVEKAGGRDYFLKNIYLVIGLFVLIKLSEAVREYIRLRSSARLSENLGYNMRQFIFEKLQRATYEYHKNIYNGDIIQRCSTDITTVRNFVIEMTDIIRVVSKIIIAYWFMARISFKLSLVSFLTVPRISFFSMFFYSRLQLRFTEADEAEGRLQTRVQENLSAPRVVRAFGKQKYELDTFIKQNNAFADMWIKVGNLLAWFWSTGDLLTVLQVVLVLCAGTVFAVRGDITSGQIITFMVYNGMLAWPIRSLGRIVGDMSRATVALRRVNEIYICDTENYENGIRDIPEGDIEFRNVSFSFDKQKIFDHLSFTIRKGETVAVLGSSGSGKSTILALLARFYEPREGAIYIGGTDIRDINLHALRRKIGIVMQEPFLFSRSIKENIGITDPVIDMDRVMSSARTAQVDRTIKSFPKGYDTVIGEQGVTLSGGQRQRVAIARTLYSGADVLCFDDSLSAVDSLTDSNIRKELKKHIRDLTAIIISQRVNTLKDADRILVLDEGRIVRQGSHEELVRTGGIYAEIVKIQSDIILQTREEANAQ
ncbi:MAG: ABC transporter ATP-binding protein [Oscillospiraceae bacterium]|nr:ABC transporter ATP-binding protein [Oscillospiraceae bacterium]